MEIEEIIKQIEMCEFKDKIGHKIEMNVAFAQFKDMVEKGWIKILCPECKGGGTRGY